MNRLFYQSTADNAYATFSIRSSTTEREPALRELRTFAGVGPATRRRRRTARATATVLGMFAEWECRTAELRLSAGDLLAIYADGITEAFDSQDDEFGEGRLVETLHAIVTCRHEN